MFRTSATNAPDTAVPSDSNNRPATEVSAAAGKSGTLSIGDRRDPGWSASAAVVSGPIIAAARGEDSTGGATAVVSGEDGGPGLRGSWAASHARSSTTAAPAHTSRLIAIPPNTLPAAAA